MEKLEHVPTGLTVEFDPWEKDPARCGNVCASSSPVLVMVKERLNRLHHVYGKFELKAGKLTFRTTDAAIVQRIEQDRARGEPRTAHLLSAEPNEEFVGCSRASSVLRNGKRR
jgi:hypothetical protein